MCNEIREVLRRVRGEGLRSIERLSRLEGKTVRRYVTAATEAGLDRAGGKGQLSDVSPGLLTSVCEAAPPTALAAEATLVANHDQLKNWLVTRAAAAPAGRPRLPGCSRDLCASMSHLHHS